MVEWSSYTTIQTRRQSLWTAKIISHEHNWSLNACVGCALLQQSIRKEAMVCSTTLYNELWARNSPRSVAELPEALKRKVHKNKVAPVNKRVYGSSIAALREEEGHCEGNAAVGLRSGMGPRGLRSNWKRLKATLRSSFRAEPSKLFRVRWKDSRRSMETTFRRFLRQLQWTADRSFPILQRLSSGDRVSILHIRMSRGNGLRTSAITACFVVTSQKGAFVEYLSCAYVMTSAGELNGRPLRKHGYRTPEELFHAFLDRVHTGWYSPSWTRAAKRVQL